MARLVSIFCLLWCVAASANIPHPGQLVLSTITTTRLPVAVSLAYDFNGNLLSDGQRFFEWDDANQLTAVTVSNSFRMELVHDGLARRRIRREYTWQSASGYWQLTSEVRYVYDGRVVVQERDGNNLPLVTYTRGPDLSGTLERAGGIGGLLARTDNPLLAIGNSGGHAYYHADGNGNVTCLINGNQIIVAHYLYDPYGNILSQAGPLAEANLYRFSSKELHVPSGLVYYRYRFYESALQRWMSRDQLGERAGGALYRFLQNAPVNQCDPYGLEEWGPTISGSAGVSGVTGIEISTTVAPLTSKCRYCVTYQVTVSIGPQMGFYAGLGGGGTYTRATLDGPGVSLGAGGFAGNGPGVNGAVDISVSGRAVSGGAGHVGPTVGVGGAFRLGFSCTGCANWTWGLLAPTVAQLDAYKCIYNALAKLTGSPQMQLPFSP